MLHYRSGLTAVGVLLLAMAAAAPAQEEMVANPFYKFWAASKPGARATHVESTKLSGPEGKAVPDGVDEKRISYKLVELTKDKAVVEMVVTEKDFLGYVQAAPTRYIYPAKLKKSRVERIFQDAGKSGEETVKVAGKGIKCKTVQGHVKGPNGEQIEYKVWLSDAVPGRIVKQIRTARQKEETIAETTTTLQSYKAAK